MTNHSGISESVTSDLDTVGLSSFIEKSILKEKGSLRFETDDDSSKFAVLHGYIDRKTPKTVDRFIKKHPQVTTLVFMQISGSKDDDANLIAAKKLKAQNYNYYLPSVNAFSQDAFIASGAVDMFLSGKNRIVDKGAEVGVHSWSAGDSTATDYPKRDSIHNSYISYYINMGLTLKEAKDFYYFTINSAPHDSIHFMTNEEITQYKLRTP